MIVQVRLGFRIEFGFQGKAFIEIKIGHVTEHAVDRLTCAQSAVGFDQVHASVPVARFEQRAQRTGDDGFPAARQQFGSNHWGRLFGRNQVDPGHFHQGGDIAARGHAYAAPGTPVNRNGFDAGILVAHGRADLAQQVVGGGIVCLAGIAKASGHRGEEDDPAREHAFGFHRLEQVEEAVGFYRYHQTEFFDRFHLQFAAAFHPSRVQEGIDMALGILDLLYSLIDQRWIGHVTGQVVRLAAQVFDNAQGLQGGGGTFDAEQRAFHLHRGWFFTFPGEPGDQFVFQAFSVAGEPQDIRIVCSWQQNPVEQVESTLRGARQILNDRADDSAGTAGDQEYAALF